MVETGALLKKQREDLGLSIPEVSRSLKIKPKMIQSIESGLIDEMPNKPFVRGFVKSYASFLKLDTASVVDMLDLELGGSQKNLDIEEKTHNSSSWFRKVRTKKKPKNKKLIVFTVFSVIAAIAANYSFKYLNSQSLQNPSQVNTPNETLKPIETIKEESLAETLKKQVPEIRPTVTSATGTKKMVTVTDVIEELEEKKSSKDKPTYQLPNSSAPIAFARPTKPPQIPFADPLVNPAASIKAALPKKPTTIKEKVEPIKEVKPKVTSNTARKIPVFKQELRIFAADTTKIVFQIDKDIKRTLNLNKGQTHRLKAFEKVWLSIEDAGNIFIFHNKKDLGKAGAAGETKELVFDN